MLLGLNIFNQLSKKHCFQLFTQVVLIFTGGKQLTVGKKYPNKQKQPPLPSVRCSHSFCRRGCIILQSGGKGSEQPQKQTPVPGRAMPKPAPHRPHRVKASDQTAIETLFPEGSAISTAYIKYFYSKVFNFFFFNLVYGRQHIPLLPKTSNEDFASCAAAGTHRND